MLTAIEKILFLHKIELFASSSPESLIFLARIADEKSYSKGKTVLFEGQKSEGLFIIADGEVNLIRNNVTVALLKQDEIIGTWALFDEESWPYSASAKTDVTLLLVRRQDFYDLLDDYPEISRGLFIALSRKIRSLVGQLDDGTRR